MDSTVDFAILAPVPEEHLASGESVANDSGYVSFGSMKWELFRAVDELRSGERVPVLIYPSHEEVVIKLAFQVAWTGWYLGHVSSYADKHFDETNGHRPPTTAKYKALGDHAGEWAVFWRVEGLRRLPEAQCIPIRDLESYKTGYWRKNAPPRGPEIVARPPWI